MAFDQTTRNRLQRFVNDARRVLEEEFTRQLQNDYGMDPNSGTVTELASLRHINDAQRESARILRDTLTHYCAGGDMDVKQGLDRIVREQAFTVLNRLAALRMAEARGLLVESVGRGFQARGFQLYARLAGTGLGETGDAYRTYLFSVFDELSQDLPGLFDRYSPQGRLFPREAALLQVLSLINAGDIATLWSEDETIGWIYQYFNSKEERKAMRDASQAPRNSRELAVRNQFFTPRYVVEFLVDNTLGRLWFNATSGQTSLRERCQYLLVKPDEALQAATKLRDPRSLKLLDPACGSMHFGLYAFDLFAEIYRESWAWEQQHGPGSLYVSTQAHAALKPLRQTYEDEAAFLRDVPRLIIEHNIYGVDIDPRAAQIASLALWLRAQRAWHDVGVKAKDRPLIGRGHVVAAIAPPAERELRRQFAASLDQRDAELFEKTLQLLKGLPELGVLLQVERELPHLIRQVYVGKGTGLFAEQEQENWQQAEARLREALTEFAQAAKSTYQGRLFAQDALQGLRLIDVCREVFDVVVMNPPFGELPATEKGYLDKTYANNENNILSCFIYRAIYLLGQYGYVGFIVDKTVTVKSSYSSVRERLLEHEHPINTMLDLGWGVLDDAQVETICMTLGPSVDSSITFYRPNIASLQKGGIDAKNAFSKERAIVRPSAYFEQIPNKSLAYDLPEDLLSLFGTSRRMEPGLGDARQGLGISDSWRWYRAISEIKIGSCGDGKKYRRLTNGGGYSPYFRDADLALYWEKDGEAIKAAEAKLYGSWSRTVKNVSYYFRKGVSFPKRTDHLNGHLLPEGFIFTVEGLGFFPLNAEEEVRDSLEAVCLFNSRLQAFLINKFCGQHKHVGYIKSLPLPSKRLSPSSLEKAKNIFGIKRFWASCFVNTAYFYCPAILFRDISGALSALGIDVRYHEFGANGSFKEKLDEVDALVKSSNKLIEELQSRIDDDVFNSFSIADDTQKVIFYETESRPVINIFQGVIESSITNARPWVFDLIDYLIGVKFGRWDVRVVTEKNPPIGASDMLSTLPPIPPGMLTNSEGFLFSKSEFGQLKAAGKLDYPIEPAWDGILVNDSSHALDIVNVIQELLAVVTDFHHEIFEHELCEALEFKSILDYFNDSIGFFADHLQRYSKSRRKAPIYWPLSTTSGSYTLWIYYTNLTSQTLYTTINDFVEPKLKQVDADVTTLRNKGAARTREDEKQFEALQTFELELIELRDTLLKLAPTYKPNHDDGVQISAAPLWPLFRHKPWQKVLKDTWAKLEKGDYDWAHMAMNYWPGRVRDKCKTDKSLAIAHGLKDLYVEPPPKPKKTHGKKKARGDE